MADNKFQDLTPEDFGEAPIAAAPVAQTPAQLAATLKEERPARPKSGPSQAELIEPSWLKRGLAGAGHTLVNKYRGLTGQEAAPSYGLEEDTAGSVGMMIPDAIGSMLAPARILPQMTYGAVSSAMDPASNELDRLVAGLKGGALQGAGQGLASGVVKGTNAIAKNLTREGEAALAAKSAGLNLSAGDLLNSKLLRLAEEKSPLSPSRGQAAEVEAIMNTPGGDPITIAIQDAYKGAQNRVSEKAQALDSLIAQGELPGVVPRKLYESIQRIKERSPDTLKNVRDPQISQVLEDIANYQRGKIPKRMGFAELDELRKALGPVMAKVEAQSTSGASNVTTADANRWKQLYKGIMEDIEGWGSSKATEDALKLHKELSSTFKNEVLPLRQHPVAGKVLDEGYARPEDLLRDLTSVRNKSIINDLYGRLDQRGKNAFDALRLAQRGSREFVKGEPSKLSFPERLGIYGAIGSSPAWAPATTPLLPYLAGAAALEQGLVHGLNTPIGRMIASGSPQAAKGNLGNAAIYSGLRSALPQTIRNTAEELE